MSVARSARPDSSAVPLLDSATPTSRNRPRRKATPGQEPQPHWRDFAACVDQDLNLFFPMSSTGLMAQRQADAAKQVCQACPVRQDCLEWALEVGPEFGVFGGTTEGERRVLRSLQTPTQQLRSVPTPIPHRSEEAVVQALEPH